MGKRKPRKTRHKEGMLVGKRGTNKAFEAAGLGQPDARRMKRILDIYEDVCDGLANQTQMAIRYGVTTACISQDMAYVWALFHHNTSRDILQDKMVAEARLDKIIRNAAAGYERSKENHETITTDYKQVVCEDCKGSGKWTNEDGEESEEDCTTCEGRGRYIKEIAKHKVEGQSGNPQFLREQRQTIELKAKIQGLIEGKREYHFHDEKQLNVDLKNVDPQMVIDALSLNRKIQQQMEGSAAGDQDDN